VLKSTGFCILKNKDQGVHYTSLRFQNLLKQKGIKQLMSRRDNYCDNVPMVFLSYERSFRIKKNLWVITTTIDINGI